MLASANNLRGTPLVALQTASMTSTGMSGESVIEIVKKVADDDTSVSIAVDDEGLQYVVTQAGKIYVGSEKEWEQFPGTATDIAVGADGSLWAIGASRVGKVGDGAILKWTGNDWEAVSGSAKRIAVGPSGRPWVVNEAGQIFERKSDNSWHMYPGDASDIGAGADGSIWIIGASKVGRGGNAILEWTGMDWRRVNGAAVRVSVGPNGLPWVVTEEGNVFERLVGNTWSFVQGGASDIGVGGKVNDIFVSATKAL